MYNFAWKPAKQVLSIGWWANLHLLARARAHWVWVDLKTGKPIRIPSGFKKDLAGNIVQVRA